MSELTLLLAILSIPHIYYYYVWTQSKHFMKMCKKYTKNMDPVLVFSKTSYIIKLVQFFSFAVFYFRLGDLDLGKMSLLRLIPALIFFAVGQILNAGIYKAIGVNGVYYGCRLGKEVPWYEGFPFNVVPNHPQYIGSAASIWGLMLLLANGPQHNVLYLIGFVWSFYYFISSMVEQYL